MKDTNFRAEYLLCDKEIITLAKNILSEKEISYADAISEELTTKNKNKAIGKLYHVMGINPKNPYFARPLYYLHHELQFLPRWTRNNMRYLGDYIDQLVKASAVEKVSKDCEYKSLGINLKLLKGKIDDKLWESLAEYNKILYVVAKHDFNVRERRHRFTSKEVVYCCFISNELSNRLFPLSKRKKYYPNGIFNY